MNSQEIEAEFEEAPSPISEKFSKLDVHLQLLIQENHPRVMNLEKTIPSEYPWEDFLRRHFATPPFDLTREDYEYVIVGKYKTLKIKDSRKPTTFYSLLRFLEFFRSSLVRLETNLHKIEEKHEKLKRAANERIGIKALLRSREWSYDNISNKHNIVQDALKEKMQIDVFVKKLETMLSQNHNITSRWQFLIEPFYSKVIELINEGIDQDSAFNLRMFFPVKTIEKKLQPYYTDSMNLAIELNEAVIQTGDFLSGKKTAL